MNRRNLKAKKVVDALKKFGCILKRNTSHGVIVENPINNKAKIIAITGTNGKTTTAKLTYQVFANALKKKRVFLGGNIGTPFSSFVLDTKADDIRVNLYAWKVPQYKMAVEAPIMRSDIIA